MSSPGASQDQSLDWKDKGLSGDSGTTATQAPPADPSTQTWQDYYHNGGKLTDLGPGYRTQYEDLPPDKRIQLDLYQRDIDRRAEDAEFARLSDRYGMNTMIEDHKALQGHISYMDDKLGELSDELGKAPPMMQPPKQGIGDMIGAALAGLFGGGAGLSQALTAGAASAKQSEDIRFANARNADLARREGLGRQYEQVAQERQQGVTEENQLGQEIARTTQLAQEQAHETVAQQEDRQLKQDADKRADFLAQMKLSQDERAILVGKNKELEDRYHDIQHNASIYGGTTDPTTNKTWDDYVNGLNEEAKANGLPPFALLPQGPTAQAKIAAEREDTQRKHFDDMKTLAEKGLVIKGRQLLFQDKKLEAEQNHWLATLDQAKKNYELRVKSEGDTKAYRDAMIQIHSSTLTKVQEADIKAKAAHDAAGKLFANWQKIDKSLSKLNDVQKQADSAWKASYTRWKTAEARAIQLDALRDERKQVLDSATSQLDQTEGGDVYESDLAKTKAAWGTLLPKAKDQMRDYFQRQYNLKLDLP